MSKKKRYDLMWHTTAYGPYYGDIGLGIGLAKVAGNTTKAMPLCPAVIRLDPKRDPKRARWESSSVRQSMPGLDPDVPIEPELELIERDWQPHVVTTRYRYRGVSVDQQVVATRDGIVCSLSAESPIRPVFRGAGYGSCKIGAIPADEASGENPGQPTGPNVARPYAGLNAGLHIIETAAEIRPVEYTVRFDPAPESIRLREPEAENREGDLAVGVRHMPGGGRWEIAWESAIDRLEIRFQYSRSFGPAKPHLEGPGAKVEDRTFASKLQAQRREWEAFLDTGVPHVECPDPRIEELNRYLAWVYRSNAIHHGGILPYPYSIPKQTFVGWWMWDTAKAAIAGSWYGEREIGWGGLLNAETLQYPEGLTHGGIVTNSAAYYGVNCWPSEDPRAKRYFTMPHTIPEVHDSGTHPPMMSTALWSLWSVDRNNRLAERLVPTALAFDRYFDRMRASRTLPGLLVVRRWSDSGMDNSRRWGNQGSASSEGREKFDEIDWSMPVVSVDLNVYSIVEKRCLASLLRGLDAVRSRDDPSTGGRAGDTDRSDRDRSIRYGELAAQLEEQADERAAALHRALWNDESGMYVDRDEERGRYIPVVAPTGLSPLLLPELPEDRIDSLVCRLLDEDHFWTDAPIPSISRSDPYFRPSASYWQGPVWMSYTMDILRGLYRHRREVANRLLDRLLAYMLPSDGPAVYENYNPLTGQFQDCPNFSWNGQIIDIVLRDMLGIAWTPDGVIATSVGAPADWTEWRVTGLPMAGGRWDVEGARTPSESGPSTWQHTSSRSSRREA